MADCETCKYFDLHPFIRENDWDSWCDFHNKKLKDIGYEDKAFCNVYEEYNEDY